MSDTEAEPIHLNLVFEAMPDAQTVPSTPSEGSRKRPADEPSADVPSASRRRRVNHPESTPFTRPSFPSTCCVNGIVQPPVPACLLQPSQVFESSGPTSSSASSLPPLYRPQVIAPQVHAQMAAMPSTSTVNNMMAPVTFHVHTPPILLSNFASSYAQITHSGTTSYYLGQSVDNMRARALGVSSQQPSAPQGTQPIMGLRLPTTPVAYAPSGPQTEADSHRSSDSGIAPNMQMLPEQNYLRQLQQMGSNIHWESAGDSLHHHNYPGPNHGYNVRDPGSRIEMLLSRVRQVAAQAAVQVAVDTTAQLIAAHQAQGRGLVNPPVNETLPAQQMLSHNRVDGPVAVPTLATEWARRGTQENVPMSGYVHPELASIASGDIPFRAWEAAVLQIFDRMAPQMNLMRLPPKGMPKSEIEQLKSFRLIDPKVLMEKVCVVCQCEFEKRDHVRVLPCDHHYHMKCVDKWLKTNRTCPICRKSASESMDAALGTATSNTGPTEPHVAVQVITQINGSSQPANASFSPSV